MAAVANHGDLNRELRRVIQPLTGPGQARSRPELKMMLREAIAEQGCTALTGIEGDRVLAVIAGPPPRRPRASGPAWALTRAAGSLQRAVAATDRDLSIVMGVSSETLPEALRQGFEQAAEAAAFGRSSRRGGPAHHFGDLGTYHLMARLAQGPELAAFVEAELSPLLDHDARSSAKLLPTLQAYLDNACRKTRCRPGAVDPAADAIRAARPHRAATRP